MDKNFTKHTVIWLLFGFAYLLWVCFLFIWWFGQENTIQQYDAVVYWEKALTYSQSLPVDFWGNMQKNSQQLVAGIYRYCIDPNCRIDAFFGARFLCLLFLRVLGILCTCVSEFGHICRPAMGRLQKRTSKNLGDCSVLCLVFEQPGFPVSSVSRIFGCCRRVNN